MLLNISPRLNISNHTTLWNILYSENCHAQEWVEQTAIEDSLSQKNTWIKKKYLFYDDSIILFTLMMKTYSEWV